MSTYRNAYSDGHEENKVPVIDTRVGEFVIYRDGDGGAQSKRNDEAGDGYRSRCFGIPLDNTHVDLDTDEEEKHDKTDGAGQCEHGEGLGGEDGVGKVRNATHNSRTLSFRSDSRRSVAPMVHE